MWLHPLLLSPPVLFYSPKCTCLCAYFVYHAVMPLHNLNLKVLNIRQVFPSFHLRLIPEIIKLIISKVFFFILSLNFAFPNLIPLLFIIPPPLPLGTMLINSSPSLVFAFFYPSILQFNVKMYSSSLVFTQPNRYILAPAIFPCKTVPADLYSMLLSKPSGLFTNYWYQSDQSKTHYPRCGSDIINWEFIYQCP